VLGHVTTAGVDQQVLQHDPPGRVLDHQHQFVASAAHRRRTFVAWAQQHGFVEGEVDRVLALHRQDAVAVVRRWIGRWCRQRGQAQREQAGRQKRGAQGRRGHLWRAG